MSNASRSPTHGGFSPRSRDPWTSLRMIATTITLPIATALSVFTIYGEWSLLTNGDLFWHTITRFPWLRLSLLMTLVTCLASIAGARRRSGGTILGSPLTYAFVLVPFVFLMVYPGAAALGRSSDPAAYYLIVLLDLIHGVGFYQIRRAIEEARVPRNESYRCSPTIAISGPNTRFQRRLLYDKRNDNG